jgi:two-component SAPR family response regulator
MPDEIEQVRMPLRISLFGPFQAWGFDGEPLWKKDAPAQKLLAFLVLHHTAPVKMAALGNHVWDLPDADTDKEAEAHSDRIRAGLSRIRKLVTDHHLPPALSSTWGNGSSVQFQVLDAEIDLVRFDQLARSKRPEEIDEALQLYAPLLAEWNDDWVLTARAEWKQKHNNALSRLLHLLDGCAVVTKQEGRIGQAIQYRTRAVALAPLSEEHLLDLFELLERAGDIESIFGHFDAYFNALASSANDGASRTPAARVQQFLNRLRQRVVPPAMPTQDASSVALRRYLQDLIETMKACVSQTMLLSAQDTSSAVSPEVSALSEYIGRFTSPLR